MSVWASSVVLADAATFSLSAEHGAVGVGDSFKVVAELSSPDEKVNTFAGTLSFDPTVFTASIIRDGEGAVPLWIERPSIVDDGVRFVGAIPGGLQTSSRQLFSVVLTAKKAGQATLSFKNGQVLKNDGLGTAATLAINPLAVTVVAESKKITATTAADQEPPEAFAAQINHDNNFFDGLSFVTFLAQDKISGIDHYEFTTSTNRRIGESAVWQTTNSPLLLNKKSPHYFIYIKAVDRAGNVRIVRAPANLPLWWYEKILVWIILIAVCVLFGRRLLVKK
jgi:hypothetical protein